ncbi:MAG TPA: hypothetical protein DEA40_16635 [Parvularcula sp.]|nr:hypothetical protein [Parvularcula sp.]
MSALAHFTLLSVLLVIAGCGRAHEEASPGTAPGAPALNVDAVPVPSLADTAPDPAETRANVDQPEQPAPVEPSAHMDFGAPAEGGGGYGAIAATSSGPIVSAFGSYGYGTRAAAERAAIEGCRKLAAKIGDGKQAEACRSAVYFYDGAYAGLATSSDGGWGTGWSTTSAREACRYAEASCRDSGGPDCEGVAYLCSPSGRRGTCDGGISIDGETTRVSSPQ